MEKAATPFEFEALESGQKASLSVSGEAVEAKLVASQRSVEFGDCNQSTTAR